MIRAETKSVRSDRALPVDVSLANLSNHWYSRRCHAASDEVHDVTPGTPSAVAPDDIMTWSPSFAELARRLRGQNAGDGLLPVVVFLSLERTLGLKWAIVGLTTVSVGTLVYRMRRGERVNPLLWVVLGIALLRAVA